MSIQLKDLNTIIEKFLEIKQNESKVPLQIKKLKNIMSHCILLKDNKFNSDLGCFSYNDNIHCLMIIIYQLHKYLYDGSTLKNIIEIVKEPKLYLSTHFNPRDVLDFYYLSVLKKDQYKIVSDYHEKVYRQNQERKKYDSHIFQLNCIVNKFDKTIEDINFIKKEEENIKISFEKLNKFYLEIDKLAATICSICPKTFDINSLNEINDGYDEDRDNCRVDEGAWTCKCCNKPLRSIKSIDKKILPLKLMAIHHINTLFFIILKKKLKVKIIDHDFTEVKEFMRLLDEENYFAYLDKLYNSSFIIEIHKINDMIDTTKNFIYILDKTLKLQNSN